MTRIARNPKSDKEATTGNSISLKIIRVLVPKFIPQRTALVNLERKRNTETFCSPKYCVEETAEHQDKTYYAFSCFVISNVDY